MMAHSRSDQTCVKCRRTLEYRTYQMPSPSGRLPHCLGCAVRYQPLLKKSLIICMVVGTILTAINQGNFIVTGDFQTAMAWKIPLTYTVPFIVATTGGILNAQEAVRP